MGPENWVDDAEKKKKEIVRSGGKRDYTREEK